MRTTTHRIWGKREAPLLPRSLRSEWAEELVRGTGESQELRFKDLDSSIWEKDAEIAKRLLIMLPGLLYRRRAKILRLKAFDRSWPDELDPTSIEWRVRTRNCIQWSSHFGEKGKLKRPTDLDELTYGDLFRIRNMGATTVLDFTCTSEAVMELYPLRQDDQVKGQSDSIRIGESVERRIAKFRLHADTIRPPWARRVSGDDPRFSSLLPSGQTLEDLLDSTPDSLHIKEHIRDMETKIRLAENVIEALSKAALEDQLVEFVGGVTGLQSRRLNALILRLGFGGIRPTTLRIAGDSIGLTRQRVSQLERRFFARLPLHPIMPRLDQALRILEAEAPIEVNAAAKLLQDAGISHKPFNPEGIIKSAGRFGRDAILRIEKVHGRRIVARVAGLVPGRDRRTGLRNSECQEFSSEVLTDVIGARKMASLSSPYGVSESRSGPSRALKQEVTLKVTFPAMTGTIGQRTYFSTLMPLRAVPQMFTFRDWSEFLPEDREQRVLNKKRIPDIARYITENEDGYLFASITASYMGGVRFVPSEFAPEIGMVELDMTQATFVINDGQHRAEAIKLALQMNPALGEENISVLLFQYENRGRVQQMFSDLNRYVKKTSKSLDILYDKRDVIAAVTRGLEEFVPAFKGLVEKDYASLPAGSKNLFSLAALYDANEELLKPKREEDETANSLTTIAVEFWNSVAQNMTDWSRVKKGEMLARELRQESISSHAVVLRALGGVGAELMEQDPKGWKNRLADLGEIDWSKKNQDWEGVNMVANSVVSNRQARLATKAYLKKKLALELTEAEERAITPPPPVEVTSA